MKHLFTLLALTISFSMNAQVSYSGTEASGGVSTAMGFETEASGNYSTAMGLYTEANGTASTAYYKGQSEYKDKQNNKLMASFDKLIEAIATQSKDIFTKTAMEARKTNWKDKK